MTAVRMHSVSTRPNSLAALATTVSLEMEEYAMVGSHVQSALF